MFRLRFGNGAYVIYQNYTIIAEGLERSQSTSYIGLIAGIEKCLDLAITDLDVESDSPLIISQVTRKCGARHHLVPLCEKVWQLSDQFTRIEFHLIRKEYNSYVYSLKSSR